MWFTSAAVPTKRINCTNKKDKDNPELKKRCPWVEKMKDYLESKGVEVVYGTHH